SKTEPRDGCHLTRDEPKARGDRDSEMVTLVSFDIDGTLEVGDPPGIVSIALVKTAKRLGYLVGSCSDRPISHQQSLWARLPIVAFAGLIALAVAMGIGRFAFTPILPMMQEDAGVSIAMGGWLASANYVGYLAGALSVIWWPITATTGIRVGLATIGLGTLAMGLGHHFAAWLALRAIAGVASAWVLIYVSAWCLENLASLGRPALGSTVYAGVGAGIALAGALCLALMHVGAGSAHAWIVLGALAIVLSLGIWTVFRPRAGSPGAEAARSDPRAMAWDRESLRLALCYGAFGFGYIIPATFLPVMAKQVIRDPAIFGWSW